jgi:hypothetical protein
MMHSAVDEVRTKLHSTMTKELQSTMTKGTADAGGALRSADLDEMLASAALAVLEVRCSLGRIFRNPQPSEQVNGCW